MVKKRISELIPSTEIQTWSKGDVITIKAGTGVGKSYWVKNILYLEAKKNNKKILMLIHRKNCVNQFYEELKRDGKLDTITVMTYQKLETLKYRYKKNYDFSEYDYIVADEFHYFLSDASFNKVSDISLNMILSESSKFRIFMSATGDYMKRYINHKKHISTIDYELPISFNFIKSLTFFNKDETMQEVFIREAIEKKEKVIFFIQSSEKAYELYRDNKDIALFCCGKSDRHYKYVDEDKINDMLKNERFEEQILITTTCLDAGINLIDDDLKHIVIDNKDLGSLIQCIGRKRMVKKKDGVYVYIKTINNKQLGGMTTQIKNKISMADYLREHTVKEFIEQFPRRYDASNIVYDETVEDNDKGTKVINELMYFKCNLDICDIEIMKMYGEFCYCKYLAYLFGFVENGEFNYRLIDEESEEIKLKNYLESLIGKKILKDDQKELINMIDLRVDGRQQKSYSKLNEGLKMIKMPYVIIPKKSNSIRYWIIERIEL